MTKIFFGSTVPTVQAQNPVCDITTRAQRKPTSIVITLIKVTTRRVHTKSTFILSLEPIFGFFFFFSTTGTNELPWP